jgi:hypothetical protein
MIATRTIRPDARKTHHVIRGPGGDWIVYKGGAKRATRHFESQEAAISWGRELSEKQGSDFYVHRDDGTVLRKETDFGEKPRKPTLLASTH